MPRTTQPDTSGSAANAADARSIAVAAPQGFRDVDELREQNTVNLNPGPDKGQERVEDIPAYTPRDVETVAFFEQVLIVQVHERAGLDIPGLTMNFNGEDAVIPFGRPVKLKRKFVQHLLDMRETTFTQPKRNHFHVEAGNALVPKTVLLYPFSISYDPHPRGHEWLMREQVKVQNIAAGLR